MFLIILYLLSDISPWDYWNSFNDLKESVNVILNDHVIDRHKYRTTEEAHKYRVQNTNSLFITLLHLTIKLKIKFFMKVHDNLYTCT